MADEGDDSWLYGANHDEAEAAGKQSEISGETESNTNNDADEEQANFEQQQFDEHNFEEAGDDEQVAADETPSIEKER